MAGGGRGRPARGVARPARGARVGDPDRTSGDRGANKGGVAGWGSVARRGARILEEGAGAPTKGREEREPARPVRREAEWIDEGLVGEPAAAGGTGAGRGGGSVRLRLPPEVLAELERSAPGQAERAARRLGEAARAYRRERYGEARKLLEALARIAPEVAAVRELHGLSLYRLGHWRAAIAELEAAERLSGSIEHHPVLADCRRALGHGREVERLWEELRQGGAPPAVMVEGRIVMAGALADRGDVAGAVRLLEHGPVDVRTPREHHLRLWYALAAAHEQAGDVTRARQFLRRVLDADAAFPGARDHYRALS